MQPWQLITIIIILSGIIGGYANYYQNLENSGGHQSDKIRSILNGLIASACVPLFLNLLSSELIKTANQANFVHYFVLVGFCLIAAYFSDKFLFQVSESVFQLKQKQDKIEQKQADIEKKVNESSEMVENIADQHSDAKITPEAIIENAKTKSSITNTNSEVVLNEFLKGNYKFRTLDGLSSALNLDKAETNLILNELKSANIIKEFSKKDGSKLYSKNTNLIQ